MGAPDWTAYLTAAKTALDIFKGIRAELPQGPKAEQAEKEIERAEQALQLTEAELAKALGFRLCRCEFPPPIMLWNKNERASFCPKCGDRYPPPADKVAVRESSWINSRRGGGGGG
jgi:hypothetical protein